jgi:hypothetical protein
MVPRFPYHVIEEFEKYKFQTPLSNDNLGGNESNNMIGTIKGLTFVISIVSNNSFLSTGPESITFSFTNSLESFYQVCSKIVGGQSSGISSLDLILV